MNPEGCAPLLKWAGGKRRLIGEILSVAPTDFGRYFEPFLGGGALFFSLVPRSATLSDSNPDLINAYIQIRDNLDAVVKSLRRLPNSEADYYRIRAACPRSAAGKAARLIYLCALSFNGIYRQNLNGQFNVPYGHKRHLDPCNHPRLQATSDILQRRKLIVSDFEPAVSCARRGDFIYFDPPYTVAHENNGFIKYNAKIFSWSDQQRLAVLAWRLKRSGCKVVVSNADHPSIHALYNGFRVRSIERHSVMAADNGFRRPVRESLFY